MSDAGSIRKWRISPGREFTLDRPRIMGILNVTPDSFSDGGLYADVSAACEAALRMIDEGADVIDIGGESTRPGAQRIDASEQMRRVLPAIERLRSATYAQISIDTTLSEVARAALDAGANIINDVAAGHDDPRLIELAADRGCGVIFMHRLRKPADDSYSTHYNAQAAPQYEDVVAEVARFLHERTEAAVEAGVDAASIVIDPGLGFGKTPSQNYELITRIDEVSERAGGFPVLFAASRKSFLNIDGRTPEPRDRLAASIAVAVSAYQRGVRLFRVHDVAAHRDALTAAARVQAALHNREPIG